MKKWLKDIPITHVPANDLLEFMVTIVDELKRRDEAARTVVKSVQGEQS